MPAYEDDPKGDIVLVERLDPILRADDDRDEIPKIKYHNYRQGNNCSIQNISSACSKVCSESKHNHQSILNDCH